MYGASTGAAIGSVVPVVGTAVGAALGGIMGAATGAAAGLLYGSGGSYNGVKKIFDACETKGMGKSTMNGGTLDSISKKLYDAVRVWTGTDEDAIKDALSQLKTIPDFCSVIKRYEENYPGEILFDETLTGFVGAFSRISPSDNKQEWLYFFKKMLPCFLGGIIRNSTVNNSPTLLAFKTVSNQP